MAYCPFCLPQNIMPYTFFSFPRLLERDTLSYLKSKKKKKNTAVFFNQIEYVS